MLSSEPSAKSAVWSTCGYALLEPTARGWLKPTPAYWRLWLNRPELALVEESCAAEQKLHAALLEQPTRVVKPAELKALADTDVQHNYRHFLNLRDAVEAAGSLEAAYAGFFKAGAVQLPPLFLDLMVQAIACHLLQDTPDMWQWRAAEMLFRRQRVSVQDGRVLGGDSEVLDMNHETGGLGTIGRLLKENSTALPVVNLQVLNDANAARYQQSLAGAGRFNFLLDLTHEVQRELPHGLTLTMTRAQSGLKALAQVLEKWVQHFLGTEVQIQPESRVDDAAWRWHVGLDTEATQLLNDLYEGQDVSAERQRRLISLFRLRFKDPQHMRPDVQGKPVYLGLAMNAEGLVKLKPQNLLLNLPLARAV
jgi:hypothetical protein